MLFGVMPSRIRRESINPFRFGALALDDAFADRTAELRTLVRDVRNGQDVVIFAPRRFGKSSLAWRAAQQLTRSRVLVAQLDLMNAPTKARLAERLADTIFENVASPLERARERALAPFRGLQIQPTVNVDPADGSLSFSFTVGRRASDLDATLERLLALPGELGAAKGRRVALILDEFQEIVAIDRKLPMLLRSVFQRQPEVAHVYLGSKRHIMERIFNDENEPFWRSAKPVELGPIPTEEFAEFVVRRFEESGRRLGADAVEAIMAATGGHPYATQELCYFLWEVTDARRNARAADVEAAIAVLLRAEDAHFTLVWEQAAAAQRLVLAALAREQPARPLTGEYRREHGLPATATVQKALGALEQRELIARGADGYRIAEPFLAEWIRATRS
jgi:uncharacterized protein